MRYTAAGVLDTTFATSGIALSGQPNDAAADAIAVQPDDRVVVAGYTTPGAHPLLTVWRLTADGALDSTFGTGGVAAFSFASGGRASSVALQADGRIVVSGVVYPLGQVNMVVFRLMPDGTLDTSFGSGGLIVSTSSTSDYADVVGIAARRGHRGRRHEQLRRAHAVAVQVTGARAKPHPPAPSPLAAGRAHLNPRCPALQQNLTPPPPLRLAERGSESPGPGLGSFGRPPLGSRRGAPSMRVARARQEA